MHGSQKIVARDATSNIIAVPSYDRNV